jgi:TfoX/Sxy family transcriptional regulator of competence genes
MAKKYRDRLAAMVDETTPKTLHGAELECRHFFSGAALYVNGMICASLTPVGFALKLPEPSRAVLLRTRRAHRLRYFPAGPIKKDYVVLSRAILNSPTYLRRWLLASIKYVAGQEPHRRRRRSTR